MGIFDWELFFVDDPLTLGIPSVKRHQPILQNVMKKPSIGHLNLAALIGACIGSITGLFAVGIAPAIIEQNARMMLAFPSIGLICFFLGGVAGWIVGGELGPRLGRQTRQQRGQLLGGLIGGALPFAVFALSGWYLHTH